MADHWAIISSSMILTESNASLPLKSKTEKENLFKKTCFQYPYGFKPSNFITFVIKRCNKTVKLGCSKALAKVRRFFVNVIFIDTYQDLSNRDNLINNNFTVLTTQVSIQLFTINYYDISSSDLIIKNGMIFRDESSSSFHQIKSEKSVVDFYNDNIRLMFNFTFFSGLQKKVMLRRYLKVPELIASIGGIIKAINLLC